MTIMNRSRQLALFLLAIVAHIESLTYWFVATDTTKLIVSSRVLNVGDAVELFTQPMMYEADFTDIALFYRPIASLSYAIDYAVWGLDPTGYHLTNLVLHGVVVVLVAIVVTEITNDSIVGQLSAVLVALHPLMAEVVPAAPRRHDIVMAIFVLGSLTLYIRSKNKTASDGRANLVGALVLYALALGAKEPALLVPGLLFVWTAIQQYDTGPYNALRTAVRAVIPFGVVTVVYLAVRVAVLGGLGGYHHIRSGPVTLVDEIRVVVEYVISLAYPADVIGNGLAAGGLWMGVLLILAMLIVLVSLCGVSSLHRERSSATSTPLLAGFIGGCTTIALLIAFSPEWEILGYLVYRQPAPRHSYLYPSMAHAAVGLILLGSCCAGLLWAMTTRASAFTEIQPALAFFVIWLLAPLALFFRNGLYTIRTGYLSVIPAMAILALVLVSAGREIWNSDQTQDSDRSRQWSTPLDQNIALVGIVLLLIVPIVATSPLFHPYDSWETAGELNRQTFVGLDNELDGELGESTTVQLIGAPSGLVDSERSFPRVKSVVYMDQKAVQSWLMLQRTEQSASTETTVATNNSTELQRIPDRILFETTREQETVVVRFRYENKSAASAMQLQSEYRSQCGRQLTAGKY